MCINFANYIYTNFTYCLQKVAYYSFRDTLDTIYNGSLNSDNTR